METKLRSSRKRKQRSNPFEGIFTRSKSQIYLHQNRSGHARSDAIRRRHNHQFLNAKAETHQLHPSDSLFSDGTTHTSVKDLRARRVFSPASIIKEDGSTEKIELVVDFKGAISNDGNPNLPPIVEGVGFSVVGSSTPNFETIGDSSGIGDAPSAGKSLDQDGSAANSTDECVKMTPAELKVDCNAVKYEIEGKDDSIRKGQADFNLRSRMKVFKSPSSFSYRRLLPYLMNITQDDSCVSQIKIVDLTRSCDAQSLAGLGPKISANRDLWVSGKDQETGAQLDRKHVVEENEKFHPTNSCKILNGTRTPNVEGRCNLIEELEQMTPPDADVFGKDEVNDSFAQKGEKIMLNGNPSAITRKTGDIVENLEEQRNNSVSKPRRVLNPCARMKLLKTPSSVSYRRLLPFLMDIAKDDSCTLTAEQCPKDEKAIEQKPHSHVLDYDHDTTVCNSVKGSELGKQDSEHEKPSTPTSSSIPNESDGTSEETTHMLVVARPNSVDGKDNIKEPSVGKISDSTEVHITPDSQLEVELQLEHLVEDIPEKSNKEPDLNNQSYGYEANFSSSILSTALHENIPSASAKRISGNSLIDAKDDVVGPKTLDINQNLSLIEGFGSLGVHVAGRRKGILKRNPPGCKGICDCLNCASFRLHAERAFEFSRNQMISAEELAVELIEEITCLRSVLQKSAVDANHEIVLQGNQVNEVCRRALETEELAKQRIAQMNEELSIHCRRIALERPRVSFARNVEEKVIAKG